MQSVRPLLATGTYEYRDIQVCSHQLPITPFLSMLLKLPFSVYQCSWMCYTTVMQVRSDHFFVNLGYSCPMELCCQKSLQSNISITTTRLLRSSAPLYCLTADCNPVISQNHLHSGRDRPSFLIAQHRVVLHQRCTRPSSIPSTIMPIMMMNNDNGLST